MEVDVKYLKYQQKLHSDLPFLSEIMKTGKCHKLVCNIYDKNDIYVVHIKALTQDLDYRLILKKVHRAIKFNQNYV